MPIALFRQFRSSSAQDLFADARAGFQVAMLDTPQGMAYAAIAGLPLRYGTMSSAGRLAKHRRGPGLDRSPASLPTLRRSRPPGERLARS